MDLHGQECLDLSQPTQLSIQGLTRRHIYVRLSARLPAHTSAHLHAHACLHTCTHSTESRRGMSKPCIYNTSKRPCLALSSSRTHVHARALMCARAHACTHACTHASRHSDTLSSPTRPLACQEHGFRRYRKCHNLLSSKGARFRLFCLFFLVISSETS